MPNFTGVSARPLLEHRAAGVEGRDRGAARVVVGAGHQLVGQRVDDVVGDRLPVGRDVVRRLAVEVGAAHLQRVAPSLRAMPLEDQLDDQRALRPAEAAEGGVALRVRLRAEAVDGDFGQPVGVVEVADRARHHRRAQVGAEAGVADHRHLGAEDAPGVVVADLVVELEAVAPAGDHEVVVAVGAQLHRAVQPPRRHRGDAGEQRRLRFLAAEAAAHAPALHQHRVRRAAQRVRHHLLHLAGVLGRAVHAHAAVFQRHGVADLAFQVELLLPALHEAALQPVRRAVQRALQRAGRGFAQQVHRRHHVGLGGMRLAHRQHRRQRLDVDERPSRVPPRGAPRRACARSPRTPAGPGSAPRRRPGSGRRARSGRTRCRRGCARPRSRPPRRAARAARRGRCPSAGRAPAATGPAPHAACRPARAGRRCRWRCRPRAGAPTRVHGRGPPRQCQPVRWHSVRRGRR